MKVRDESRRVLTIREAAAKACVSKRTIYQWITDGRIDYTFTVTGQYRVYEDGLLTDTPMTLHRGPRHAWPPSDEDLKAWSEKKRAQLAAARKRRRTV